MFYAPVLHHYRKGDDLLAVDAAHRGLARLTASGKSLLEQVLRVVLAAACGQLGYREEATNHLATLRKKYDWEIGAAKSLFEDLNACAELVSRIEEGLEKAATTFPPS
jgi:hypothetical protein